MDNSPCNCNEPFEMTASEFAKKHRDFKSIERNATTRAIIRRSALRLCPVHGTTSCTVTIIKQIAGESRSHKD